MRKNVKLDSVPRLLKVKHKQQWGNMQSLKSRADSREERKQKWNSSLLEVCDQCTSLIGSEKIQISRFDSIRVSNMSFPSALLRHNVTSSYYGSTWMEVRCIQSLWISPLISQTTPQHLFQSVTIKFALNSKMSFPSCEVISQFVFMFSRHCGPFKLWEVFCEIQILSAKLMKIKHTCCSFITFSFFCSLTVCSEYRPWISAL